MRDFAINWMAYKMLYFDGYGIYNRECIRALDRREHVQVYPMLVDDWHGFPAWMHLMRGANYGNLTISCMPPHELQDLPGRQWAYTMTEGTSIPDLWVEKLNRLAERVIVPSEWLVEVFGDRIRPPIHVVPGGINPVQFPIVSARRDSGQPFTFLVFGDRGGRKGWDRAWIAFTREFSNVDQQAGIKAWRENREVPRLKFNENVRMMVKVRPGGLQFLDTSTLTGISRWSCQPAHMSEVYPMADCVVIPSRAEGWGFFAREAAAMGIPTIVGNWTGHAPDAKHWATVPLERCTQVESYQRQLGDWFEPDLEELAWAMRWVYGHQDEAKQKALDGAHWLRKHQTWDHTAKKIEHLLEQYG